MVKRYKVNKNIECQAYGICSNGSEIRKLQKVSLFGLNILSKNKSEEKDK